MARLYRQAACSDRPAWEHGFVAKGIAFGSATVDEVLRLSRTGLGAREVALQTGVSRATVTRWLRGGTPVPDRRPRCVRCAGPLHEPASKAAYAYLLGLYLGDGHVSGSYSWTLTIACDQSYPGIIREARTAITEALPTCDLMGIAWRPWGRWHISVARRDAVALLDEHVGPKS
ncbi:MAG: helix-turn-helix domain-containing protein [Acidobacteria bacterium]|nr:helix-turn-helix domain-containing protein [Acidobacteriota bacterium]